MEKPKGKYMIFRFFTYMFLFLAAVTTSQASLSKAQALLQSGKTKEAHIILEQYAQKGDGEGAFLLSLSYLFGTKKQTEEGLRLMAYAVSKNHPPALDTMAGFYLHGDFVSQDKNKALSLYEKSANLGYGPSQFNCGIMYGKGDGNLKNYEKAYVYLSLAALNTKDLDLITQNAAHYRDEVTPYLSPAQRTAAAIYIHHRVGSFVN